MGADVTVLDIDAGRMAYLEDVFDMRPTVLYNTDDNLEAVIRESDLIVGAVLVPAAKTPVVVRREHLKLMKKGAVVVDVAVDQGGCMATTHPTTHDDPVFEIGGVIHYCVANMPGAVPMTSTQALTGATLPYGLSIATHGLNDACRRSPALLRGLNVYNGKCVNPCVAKALNRMYTPAESCLTRE
jgi:alanine dehydrogenase